MKIKFTFVVLLLLLAGMRAQAQDKFAKQWKQIKQVEKQIQAPVFPAKDFLITDYGAVPDSATLNTDAIAKAIAACNAAGGGRVVVPEGVFCTGAIHLKSNVNLHLQANAVLSFSTSPAHYLPVVLSRWEGWDCYNYSPLVYAYQQENVAITGPGKLDGNGSTEAWWSWKGREEYGWKKGMPSQGDVGNRDSLEIFEQQEVAVEKRIFGEGFYLRPPFVQFFECKNILMEDFTITNAPFWVIHPLLSENITYRRVKNISYGPNNDGFDPESCKNILVEDCIFDNGDDCIAIKSGRNKDGRKWNIPSENIIIRNCEMKNGHGGVVIGSEVSGGCRNVFVDNCVMDSPELDRAIRIKTNSYRGGIIENIFVRNVKVGEVKESVLRINCMYENASGEDGGFNPHIRNIWLYNVSSSDSKYALYLEGLRGTKNVHSIYVTNCNFSGVKKENIIVDTENVVIENTQINK